MNKQALLEQLLGVTAEDKVKINEIMADMRDLKVKYGDVKETIFLSCVGTALADFADQCGIPRNVIASALMVVPQVSVPREDTKTVPFVVPGGKQAH